MNIIIYHHTTIDPTRGGIQRMSKAYFDILTSAGHQVWLMALRKGNHQLLESQLCIEGQTREEQKLSFCEIVSRLQVKVMIYQDGIAPNNNYVLEWAKACEVNIINVMHSTFNGMYGINARPILYSLNPQFLRTVAEKLVNKYFVCKYKQKYRQMFSLSDRVVLLSNKFRSETTYFTGWNDFSKFLAIPNAISIKDRNYSDEKKEKKVVCVGRLSVSKKIDLLLRIWQKVEPLHVDWSLDIVGDGRERNTLESLAKKLNLKHVRFLGFQSPEPFYQEASIFCLTSGFESFGLVLVESMAFGCVPMAFNSYETASDIIEDGKSGILVPPFDIDEYANKLSWLMDNETIRKEMAAEALEKCKDFDIEKIGQQWIRLIAEIETEIKS